MLINKQLFCASRHNLNDPHDGLYSISEELKNKLLLQSLSNAKEALKHKGVNIPDDDNIILSQLRETMTEKEFYEILHDHEDSVSLNVCSFSESFKDELMWAHYASNFTGVCLEFDFSIIPGIENVLLKINYDDQLPVINDFTFDEFKKVYSYKRKAWEYENEWRIITIQDKFIRFDPKSLKTIIFGMRTNQSKIDSIKKLCNSNGLTHMQFKKLNLTINGVNVK